MPMVGGWKHHRDGQRREILSCDRLWGKKYIGCYFPAEEGEKCLVAMERLAKRAREIRNMAESEKMKRGGYFWRSRARLFRSVQG